MVAMFVFVTFPRVSQGWAGRGEQLATSIAGFSDEISIGQYGSTILANPQIVLRVEFPDGPPSNLGGLHWRGKSYDNFDGVRWTRSEQLPPSSAPRQWYRDLWSGQPLEYKVFGAPLDVRVLFSLHPVLDIDSENGIQPLFDNAGGLRVLGLGRSDLYGLRGRGASARGVTPARESRLHPLGRHTTSSSRTSIRASVSWPTLWTDGLTNRYDRVVAIRDWLRQFGYTRELPASAAETSLEHFLFERRAGHCEYFSTAMVVMLRSLGIQARNVNGFLGGEWSQFGDYLAVTQNQAHSWVEVWFQGYGWVTFDPTPAGAEAGTVTTSWFWPGRIFFDGLQHRWGKWVLDYGTDEQAGVFAGLFSADPSAAGAGAASALTRLVRLLGGVLVALTLLGGFVWARRGTSTPGFPPATRMYVQLRTVCARSGVGVLQGTTPAKLLDRVREASGSAARLDRPSGWSISTSALAMAGSLSASPSYGRCGKRSARRGVCSVPGRDRL